MGTEPLSRGGGGGGGGGRSFGVGVVVAGWVLTNVLRALQNIPRNLYIVEIILLVRILTINVISGIAYFREIILESSRNVPDSKVHGDIMGTTWVLSGPDGPMLAPWTLPSGVGTSINPCFPHGLYKPVNMTVLWI